jgi:3-hydroxyisobutyrate dehydrogenase
MKIENVGWIGTGVMGFHMCMKIIDAGYTVYVHNRTKEKAVGLLDEGAVWCDTPGDVGSRCQLVFTIVGYPDDVTDVILGDKGVLANMESGSIIIDMTTSRPSLARRVFETAAARSISSLDAPVSGGDVGARQGTLAIMVGGDKDAFDQVLPLFELMGENISLLGPAGSGQHTKMSNQVLIASTMIGTVESILYALRAGLDPDRVIDIIGKGAAASWSINNLGRRITAGNFDPGFFIKHFVKDMGIALEEARRMNLCLPGLALAHQFYVSAMALGFENLGTQALYRVFEHMNRQQPKS